MRELITALKDNWDVIAQAPIAFGIWTLVIIGAVWIVLSLLKGSQIESLEGRLKLRDDEIADYKRKLAGATPDQARAKIDALEAQVVPPKPVLQSLPPTIQLPSEDGRIFLSPKIDLFDLMKLCEDKTSVHAKTVTQSYIGKWVRYRDKLHDVYSTQTQVRLVFEGEGIGKRVKARLKDADVNLAEALHVGDEIEVVGEISEIRIYDIDLSNAEITAR